MNRALIARLEKTRRWHLLVVSVVLAVTMAVSIVAGMDWLLLGQVTYDYLVTGFVASLIVATLVVGLLIYFLNALAELDVIWHQANFDSVTGLPNRHMFGDRLEQEIKRSRRMGECFVLLFLDVDFFKEINDSYGHAKGDRLLKEVGKRIATCIRAADTVARFGGDEFVILLENMADPERVAIICQAIQERLAAPMELEEHRVFVSASIGVTFYPNDAEDAESLLKHADQAMYTAKREGRNRYSFYSPDMHASALAKTRLSHDLHDALPQGQFWLAYQPIVELDTEEIVKAEALLRWSHPLMGVVSPADFIPLAESAGLINEIGEWVFRSAAVQLQHWRSTYRADFSVGINRSPLQFRGQEGRFPSWPSQLASLGLEGQSVVVEITEGLLLDANQEVAQALDELRVAGIRIAIDDFGTGYSSLSYLTKFEIDFIKIDQSFVRQLGVHPDDLALCESIVFMAHKLGMKVIAEGIETPEQAAILKQMGCDYGQGYLFGRPQSARDFEDLLNRRQRAALEGAATKSPIREREIPVV